MTALTNIPCDECGKRIVPGYNSSLWINRAEAIRVGERVAEWEAKNTAPMPGGARYMLGSALLDMPALARWRITHVACYPQDAEDIYDLDYPRSYPELLGHVSHVMGKVWCKHTDLQEVLGECSQQRGRFAPIALTPANGENPGGDS